MTTRTPAFPEHSPQFIQSIEQYCDRCCWRCPLTTRCRVPAMVSLERAGPGRPAAVELVARSLAASLKLVIGDIASGNAPPSRSGPADVPFDVERAAKAAQSDPLVEMASDYVRAAWMVLKGARPQIDRAGDPAARDAVERLEEVSLTLGSKIYRAVAGAAESPAAAAVQGDANGSAKVALLIIEESRRRWRVLMRPGISMANGAPAKFVDVLDSIEHALLGRFPRAFEFVRPGFDEGVGSEMDRALLPGAHAGRC
jgi:hypothetical protein